MTVKTGCKEFVTKVEEKVVSKVEPAPTLVVTSVFFSYKEHIIFCCRIQIRKI
jgi:hypothetical protein